MSALAELLAYVVAIGSVLVITRPRMPTPRPHRWYELRSSNVAAAMRRNKR